MENRVVGQVEVRNHQVPLRRSLFETSGYAFRSQSYGYGDGQCLNGLHFVVKFLRRNCRDLIPPNP